MPALSKKQQKFMGIVRSIQKGEQPASKFNKDAQDVAKDMKKADVKKFASTKHKGLPMKKEMFNKINKMIKQELKEYTYGVGDVVKDVNPSCPHYGAEGEVKSVSPRSVVFIVTNKGDNFIPGQELEKTHDQMKKTNESVVKKGVTDIKDIPNVKSLVNQKKVTYRGLGVGKLKQDFYKIAKTNGYRIVVNGKEYYITDKDFKKLGGIKKMNFGAPHRNEALSSKAKPLAKGLSKKQKDTLEMIIDMQGLDQVLIDFKNDKKAFMQAIKDMSEGFSSAAQRRAAFASGYEAKGKKKKKEGINENKVYKVGDTVSLLSFDRRHRGKAKVKGVTKSRANKFGIKNHYITNKGTFTDMEVEGTEAYKLRFKGDTEKKVTKAMNSPYEVVLPEAINEKKKMFPPLKMTPKQAKEYKRFIGYAKMGIEYQIDMSLFESVNEDGHTDVASAKRKAMLVVDDANKLLNKLNGMNKEDSLPSWLSDKITLSADYLAKATDYLTNPVESIEEEEIPADVKKIAKELDKAVKMHQSQAKRLRKAGLAESKESVDEAITGGDRKVLMVIGREIKDNILKKHPNVKGQQLMKVISSVFMSMRFTPDNINYKNFKKYFPKKYNDKLLKRLGDKLHGENDSVRQTFFKQLVGESVNENILTKQLSKMINEPESSINKYIKQQGLHNADLLDFVEKLTRNSSSKRKQHIKILKSALKGDGKSEKYIMKTLYGESINEARLDPKQLLQQLGGNKFVAMTGAKNLAVDKSKNELHMKIGRNSKSISHVIIRLTSGDLYDMEFLSIRGSSRKIKSKEKGVYADQLGKMFKKNTGLDVRL